jgi:hypothetical protein
MAMKAQPNMATCECAFSKGLKRTKGISQM